jgi:COP9 signalosome complex subunit 3
LSRQQDLNLGLVSLCEDSLRRRQIQNLTETYLTLSLGAICSHVGMDAAAEKDLKEVETEIGEMVSPLAPGALSSASSPCCRRLGGSSPCTTAYSLTVLLPSSQVSNRQIYATLTPPAEPSSSSSSSARAETIVTFSDDPESYLSHETVARVTRAIENAQQLEKKWGHEANKLEASREFVQKVRVSIARLFTATGAEADIRLH